jgi:hypothetical protein
MKTKWVVVTTDKDKRGVFLGQLQKGNIKSGVCTLTKARMAVYWSKETHGVLGLASDGPAEGSHITPEIPRIELVGVTAIMDATDKAVEKWQTTTWK